MAEKLTKLRSVIRTSVTKAYNTAREELRNEKPDLDVLRRCFDTLKVKDEDLRKLNSQIFDVIEADDIEEEARVVEDYNLKIIEVCSDLRVKLEQPSNRSNSTRDSLSSVSNRSDPMSNSEEGAGLVRLPKFEVRSFDGKIAEWTEFWSCFEAGIHNNATLNPKTKLLYLKKVLEGEAYAIVRGMAISDSNYSSAIQQLKKQYGQQEVLKETHMKALTKIAPIFKTHDVSGLRKMFNDCIFHVRSLESMGVPASSYGKIIGQHLVNAVPEPMKLEFSKKYADEWELDDFLKFLHNEVEARERVLRRKEETTTDLFDRIEKPIKGEIRRSTRLGSAAALTTSFDRCRFCEDTGHKGGDCPLDIDKRKEICRKRGLCFRCLKGKHIFRECTSKLRCFKCNWPHHTWICNKNTKSKERGENEEMREIGATAVVKERSPNDQVLLQTVCVDVVGVRGKKRIRCFLDGGSEGTFVSTKLAKELELPAMKRGKFSLRSFGNETPKSHEVKLIRLKMCHPTSDEIPIEVSAIEVPYITRIPQGQQSKNIARLLHEKGIEISTHDERCDDEIHLLIGNDYYWRVATGKIKPVTEDLKALETKFGWTLMGRYSTLPDDEKNIMTIGVNLISVREDTNDILRKFWELDSIGILPDNADNNEDELKVVKKFNDTTKWKGEFYEVQLPWKRDPLDLDTNEGVALRRFWNLARKMKRDNTLYERYNTVLNEQLQEGILEEINPNLNTSNYPIYYLPHRPVIKEERSTTKLRIVFDASSRDKGCLSLNDCLHKGPNELPLVITLINEFRKGPIAITADIKQAFHRVVVRPEDRDVLRFYWFQDGWRQDEKIKPRILRSTRVMFGTSASPYLLNATIKFHLNKMETQYPETCTQLRKLMYVDDLIASVNTQEEAVKLYSEAKTTLQMANMQLVKWKTNSVRLQNELINQEASTEDQMASTKILGVSWNPSEDTIGMAIQETINRLQKTDWTKRNMIQTVATLFDPMGFVEPFTITAKILFQQSWKMKIGWDNNLPEELQSPWQRWCQQVTDLKALAIPRQLLLGQKREVIVDLHVFCDASPQAYGIVAYVCSKTDASFCTSKSRVAPLKELTIPRLELMATLLAARIIKFLQSQFAVGTITCWTDSQIALCWIRDKSDKNKPFISNRVKEIKEGTETKWWKHCPGSDNPADLLTRGITALELLKSDLWWRGPPWLMHREQWPKEKTWTSNRDEDVEEVNVSSCQLIQIDPICDVNKFSKWTRLIRTTAYVRRFISNLQSKQRNSDPLTINEINDAEIYWIKLSQHEIYPDEKKSLREKKEIPNKSNLTGVKLILDDNDLIRVENRLKFSSLGEEMKTPILIPPNHHIAKLIIRYSHERIGHGGITDTLSEIRTRYWIPRARSIIKGLLNHCFLCRRIHHRLSTEASGLLPADRVQESPPFNVTGVDFAGPLYLRNGNKSYVALFTCAVTRAIHLELVSNQTTDCFILALKRFVGRRSIPAVIYSDNAKTFKRAEKELKFLFDYFKEPRIQDFLTTKKISWKFIVENAPWWGGFWERLVRSTKTTLKKILGKASLDFEELNTVLIEVEAIINSRPLTFVYNEPGEPEAISPGHFLIGKRVTSLPDTRFKTDVSSPSINVELRKKWRHRQRLIDSLWKRWSHEYLTELRGFYRKPAKEKIMENSLVLIEDLNRTRWMWRMGRVVKLYRGRDDLVRSCEIQLPDRTIIRRPIQRLCLLEHPTGEETSRGGGM